jgi:hypothetical protein
LNLFAARADLHFISRTQTRCAHVSDAEFPADRANAVAPPL